MIELKANETLVMKITYKDGKVSAEYHKEEKDDIRRLARMLAEKDRLIDDLLDENAKLRAFKLKYDNHYNSGY